MLKKKLAQSLLVLAAMSACQSKNERQVVATIDGKNIFIESVDSTIVEKLYDRLYDIYYTRNIALEYLLADQLLKKEAINRKIAVDSLLKIEIYAKVTPSSIKEFISIHNLQDGFPDPRAFGKTVYPETEDGKEQVKQLMERELKRQFIKVLKEKYNSKILLQPPLTPKISTAGFHKYPLNKPTGEGPEVMIIADFSCSSCRQQYPHFKSVIEKYSKEVLFTYAHFSNQVTEEMLFADCAYQEQHDFMTLCNTLFLSPTDSFNLPKIAASLNLNFAAISEQMQARREMVTNNLNTSFTAIISQKVTHTPTLVMDDRIYFGEFTEEAISDYIDTILKLRN